MNKYVDSFGFYSDKPTQNGHYTGNPAIYTAYAKKLGLPIDYEQVMCGLDLTKRSLNGKPFYIRHPNKPNTSPISREEILGRFYLGHNTVLNGWSFSPYTIPMLNPLKLIKQVLEAYNKHRNYFWENNLDQLYRFSFSVPLTDRYFILKWSGDFKGYNPIHQIYRLISYFDSLLPIENGIRWLKYGKSKAAMLKEFPEDHPFRGK